jgi:photosystem II stability/assembly factor-like uncharacterized protein
MAAHPGALVLATLSFAATVAVAQARVTSIAEMQAVPADQAEALFRDLRWRNIGPANMSGRVTDIEAVESNSSIVYVGAASGGVWKSTNAGTTWSPIFEQYGTANVGDIAVFQRNPNIVWVGTGEACVRNSVAWGDGIYKSTDGGQTFTNMGLAETHHIDKVITHPTNPDIVWVAAQGHLWGYNPERGIFKTTDGGRSWRRITRGLPADDRTGATDIVIDPSNPNILYAAMWERIRRPYNFESGGPNGGIYKSTDGGESWTRLTRGLPSGPTGKIGLSIFLRNPRILTAIVEHGFQPSGGGRGGRGGGAASPDFADMTKLGTGIYRSEDGGATWQYVSRYNNRPFYFSHIYLDPNDARRVYVLAGSAQVSTDAGRTFSDQLQGIEGDFHALWIDPGNSDRYYVGNDKGAYLTHDKGESFVMFDNMDIGQFYAVDVDMRDPYYVYGGLQDSGNWGGPSNSRDFNGILNDHWFKFHSGDGMHTTVDPNDWRIVYTESQNGGIRRLDAVFRQQGGSIKPNQSNVLNWDEAIAPPIAGRPNVRWNWSSPIILSPHDSRTVYIGANHLFRSTDRGETWMAISPDLSTNDTVLTNPRSGGLTLESTGAETHATIITISESPLVPGVIWVGTDDGNVQVTRDGGRSWTNVRTNIPVVPAARSGPTVVGVPARTWVSRVEASHFDPATAYVSFDGHRSDDFKPYVFRTTDYGRTWANISANIPGDEPVYVVKEDLKSPNLLFAGTEFSALASVDGGRSWHRLMNDLPTVAVHDLVIHPRDGDLIAGTHGRSVWILDDITPLQQLTPEVLAADGHVFRQRVATQWKGVSRGATRGHMLFQAKNPLAIAHRPPANSPSELAVSAPVSFYLKSAPANGRVRIEITSVDDTARRFTGEIPAAQGINRFMWNMRFASESEGPGGVAGGRGRGGGGRAGGGGRGAGAGDEPPATGRGGRGGRGGGGGGGATAEPGAYIVRITVGGRSHVGSLTIREDPEVATIR